MSDKKIIDNKIKRSDLRDMIKEQLKKSIFNKQIRESNQSDKLAIEIDNSIIKIDDSMSYEDFALAVAKVLKDEYGSHNFEPFLTKLTSELGQEE